MKPIKSLEGKRVAIIGLGLSQVDYAIGLQNGRTWDETWTINSAAGAYRTDRMFMLDPASRFFDSNDAGRQTSVVTKVLAEAKHPIYTCELDSRVPKAVEFPLQEVCDATGCAYLNTTVAYTLAFAMWNKVAAVDLFGIDFSYSQNLHLAEAGRACVEFWIAKMMDANIIVGISTRSTILDMNVAATDRLYGYHRLKKPLVAIPHEGKFIIGPYEEINEQLAKKGLKINEDVAPPEPYKG